MGLISIPLKISHNKEWVPYKDGVELELDYPTPEQEIKIEQKRVALQLRTTPTDDKIVDEIIFDLMGYCVRCWIKGWRTIVNGEIKDGIIADIIDTKTGEKSEKLIPFKSENNLMSFDIYEPLAKSPLLIWDMWDFCRKELEFTEMDKKKLNFSPKSTGKADIRAKKERSH